MSLAPIVLFVYNRPWHTQQTIDALLKNAEAKDSDLIIYSDAAKGASGQQAVDDVRALIKEIEGFRSVCIVEQKKNMGLANSVISGVTESVNQYGKVIVLEDDLETSPCFLSYMNAALERYKDDEQVMQISGHMFPVELDTHHDMLFLPFTTTWGWATWKRAWQHFDGQAIGYQALKNDKMLRKKFDLDNSFQYFSMLEKQLSDEIDSWGIRWYLGVFMQKGLVLYPSHTLVVNMGMDGSGVHCGKGSFLDGEAIIDGFVPMAYPEKIKVNQICYVKIKNFLLKQASLGRIARIKSFLRRYFKV